MSGESTEETKGELLRENFSYTAKSAAAILFAGFTFITIVNQERTIDEMESEDKPSCGLLHACVAILLHLGTLTFIVSSLATLIKYLITQKILFSIFVSKIIIISTGGLTALNILFYLFVALYRNTKIKIAKHRADDTLAEKKSEDKVTADEVEPPLYTYQTRYMEQ
jgi:hypothetical protein